MLLIPTGSGSGSGSGHGGGGGDRVYLLSLYGVSSMIKVLSSMSIVAMQARRLISASYLARDAGRLATRDNQASVTEPQEHARLRDSEHLDII